MDLFSQLGAIEMKLRLGVCYGDCSGRGCSPFE
ncbi:hypothetical protein A2U01_0094414, partial [Trifolium medium]|nr:hypothetical protein [Trifolium medium]